MTRLMDDPIKDVKISLQQEIVSECETTSEGYQLVEQLQQRLGKLLEEEFPMFKIKWSAPVVAVVPDEEEE